MVSQFDMNPPPKQQPVICQKCTPHVAKLYNTARQFQAIIKASVKELERLNKVEEEYNKLIGKENGSKDVQAETPNQLTLEGV